MRNIAVITSPCGRFCISGHDKLQSIEFVDNTVKLIQPYTALLIETAKQMALYFRQPGFQFNLPIDLNITEFQHRVLNALQQIPIGQTRTYGEIATLLNTSARAIGNACRRNPLPLIYPCHRVVAKQHIGGFAGKMAGDLINRKRYLLDLECKQKNAP